MFPKEFQHLNIPLGDIKSATNEFASEKCIGKGGFGKVYKGELLLKDGLTVVAIKRLNSSFGQGLPEFWREIMLLSRYKHENIVSLLGFCNEGGENILVYEYLSKRSLDLYIRSTDLSWDQRLHICIGAAYGLQYLHDPQEGSQQRVLHRDIKSGNILLDENWKPKIADFGLSKYGPANQQFTFLFTNAVGTMGYCDPLYVQMGYLIKESDVYSFGVVLFEVLCGRHCVENYEDNRRFLPVLARKCYEEKTLDTIISNSLKDQISPQCLEWFSKIAYKCLKIERTARPIVDEIVTSLETALQCQEEYEFQKKKEMMLHVVSEPHRDEKNKAAPVNIIVGSHVWVKDPALAWIDGEVSRINGHEIHAHTTKGDTVVANVSKVFLKDSEAPPGGVDGMTRLSYLHEPGVLQNLAATYELNEETVLSLPNSREPESEETPQKSLNEKQQEHQDLLIRCITQDLGFSSGKPVAACLIYTSLLHWRSFEVERTSVFDRIIQTIALAIEVPDSNDVLGYWLCNTATLLTLLQRTLKVSGAAHMTPQRRRSSSASLFGRMSQGLQASPQSGGLSFLNGQVLGRLDDLGHVEAKYPALLFKQQLTAFLEKIYGMIRENLKKEISPLLRLCVQAPRTSRGSLAKGLSQANAVAQKQLIAHWQSIVKSLDNYLKMMKANFVPPFLVRIVFTQIFSFINVQLFNSLLLRRECCSFSNGEYVKAGLAELEEWCCYATEEYAGTAWDELKHVRQAVGFLVIHQKPKKTLKEITNELCPMLSIQQLYKISRTYWDDKYGTHSFSPEVISSMRVIMTEDSNNAVSNPFLLDDDLGIPFSVADISKSMPQVDISDIEPPPLIRENSGFVFLHQRTE